MIGAMVVTLLVVGAFVAFRAANRDNSATPIRTVDYSGWVKSGRADHKLPIFVPDPLPRGWRATSAKYITGVEPSWHLGLLSAEDRYVGVEESLGSQAQMVKDFVDSDATRGEDVTIDGVTWRTWTDRGGDYAVVREVAAPDGRPAQVMVVGSASPPTIRALAGSLSDTATGKPAKK